MFSPLPRSLRLAPRTLPIILAVATCVAAMAAEAPKQSLQLASADPVVAIVNGQPIHRSDVMRIRSQLGQQAASMTMEQLYPQILRKLIDVDVLAGAARAEKLEDDPSVKADLHWTDDNVLANHYLRGFAEKAVTDQELKAAYEKLLAQHKGEEEIHARHILVSSEAAAKEIIDQLNKGADFAKLANAKSQDKGEDGGDLGWFTKDKMVPEFADAAFKLKKGEYTKTPVKTQFGWHVIQVLDMRQAKPPTFDEVKEQLKQQLASEAIQTKLKELRTAAKVQEFNIDGTPMSTEKPAPAKP